MKPSEIKALRKKLDLNQTEFGKKIGAGLRSVQNYEKGDTKPSADVLIKIQDLYADTFAYKEEVISHARKESGVISEPTENPSGTGYKPRERKGHQNPIVSEGDGVPYYDVDFHGGFDAVFNDQTVQPSYYIDFPPYNHCDAWINVTGKSMSPFISHGDIAALKKLEDWRIFIPLGEVYAIYTNEHRTIKIVTEGKDEDHLTLIPYNKSEEFVKQQIPKRIIKQMYRVHGSIKKFF